jgi:2-oxoglutarate ferredoxin oxidoreductase subunit alpha
MNPLPRDLGEVVRRYERVIVAEGNMGQLARLVRGEFLVDARSLTKVQGVPFKLAEIDEAVLQAIDELGRADSPVASSTSGEDRVLGKATAAR